MKVLFSPIGGTDPISDHNIHDGAMLHICREHRVDKVVLYMSKEILTKRDAEARCVFCLKKLGELQKREIETQIIRKPDLDAVYDFNIFYEEFQRIIQENIETLGTHDELLLNISSGTPAMKSALAVIPTMVEYQSCTLVQVTTPEEKMNENKGTKPEDIETLWEYNADNSEGHKNRCKNIKIPSLAKLKTEEIVKKHIAAYDYSAAITAAKTISGRKAYLPFLEVAHYRLLLDGGRISEIERREKLHFYHDKIKNKKIPTGKLQECFEYALYLQVKLKKKEYADFLRAMTPLLVNLFEEILYCTCEIDLRDYCKKGSGSWDEKKLAGTDIERILKKEYNDRFRYGNVYSDHLHTIIMEKSDDEKLKGLVRALREVEKNIRNTAAHEIIAITDDDIKKRTALTGIEIMNAVKELFCYVGLALDDADWNSYDRMNNEIIKKI